MDPITSRTANSSPPPALEAPANTSASRLQNLLQGINLTILGPAGTIEGPGGDLRLRLETPTLGPEDVPLNEFLQQLDSLQKAPVGPLVFGRAVDQLTESGRALARAIQADPPPDAATVANIASSLEEQTRNVERTLRDIIENSTYPNFSDFLKELVKIAQELREAATKAKMAAVQANYELMQQAADQMLEAANKAAESREKQIAADRKEAIGHIVGGIVGLLFAPIAKGMLSQVASQLVTGSFNLSANSLKSESSTLQFQSDLANVAKQRLEAAAKLIEQQTAIAEDFREIAKGLRDMVLKLYQDFISSQNQIIQRANV
jgi:hypothetical protein